MKINKFKFLPVFISYIIVTLWSASQSMQLDTQDNLISNNQLSEVTLQEGAQSSFSPQKTKMQDKDLPLLERGIEKMSINNSSNEIASTSRLPTTQQIQREQVSQHLTTALTTNVTVNSNEHSSPILPPSSPSIRGGTTAGRGFRNSVTDVIINSNEHSSPILPPSSPSIRGGTTAGRGSSSSHFSPARRTLLTDDDSENEEEYQYQLPVCDRKKELPQTFQEELNDINAKLTEKLKVKFSEYSSFFIPFYRGVHYLTNLFPNSKSRKDHRSNAKAGVPLFSSAAYSLLGKQFLDQDIDKKLLEQNARLIAKVLEIFKSEYPTEYYQFHEIYSNNHEKFHKNLKSSLNKMNRFQQTHALDCFDVYKKLFSEFIGLDTQYQQEAFQRNPFVSCSMTVKHGLKYALGLKSFNGEPLSPDYNTVGQPSQPYLGVLYTILIDPVNLLNIDPTSILGAQQNNQLTVSYHPTNNILSEYEVSFFGWIPSQYVFLTTPARVPSFKKGIKTYHYLKYGLRKNTPDLKTEDIFNKVSEHLSSIIERKVQDKLNELYHSPIYQAYWRPDGKFGSTLISPDIANELRQVEAISICQKNWKGTIFSYDIEYLGEMLLKNTSITQIEIKDHKSLDLIPQALSSLTHALQQGYITKLTLSNIESDDLLKSRPIFWSKLLRNNNLHYLDLSSNKIGNRGLLYISAELAHNSQLKTLKIADNADNYESSITLGEALSENTTLTELDFSKNYIAIDLYNGIFKNISLKILTLSGSNFNDRHCYDCLTKITNITLSLEGANIPGETRRR